MINILNTRPKKKISGRELFSVNFVKEEDVRSKKLLDIGCGYGWFELSAVKKGVGKIYGIENTDNDLITAKRYINNKKIKFLVGDALNVPFPNESFQTIVSWEVIEHIPKGCEDKMFFEINRLLKTGGVAYLSTPYKSVPSILLDPAWWLLGHRHYNLDELVKLARNNGFYFDSYEVKGGWWTIMNLLNMYLSKWVFRKSMFFEKYLNYYDDQDFQKGCGFCNIFIKIIKK